MGLIINIVMLIVSTVVLMAGWDEIITVFEWPIWVAILLVMWRLAVTIIVHGGVSILALSRNSTLAAFIALFFPILTHAQTVVNTDGSFATPTGNSGVTTSSITSEADKLSNGLSVINNTTVSSTHVINEEVIFSNPVPIYDYYLSDSNGEPINKDSTIVVDGLIHQIGEGYRLGDEYSIIYGGYCNADLNACNGVTNTNVVMKDGKVGTLYGAYATNEAALAKGNVYVTGGNFKSAKGASVSTSLSASVIGNVYVTNSNGSGSDSGDDITGAQAALSYNSSSSVVGSVYLTNSNVSGVFGASVSNLTSSGLIPNINPQTISVVSNVYLTDSTINMGVIGSVVSKFFQDSSEGYSILGNAYLTNSTIKYGSVSGSDMSTMFSSVDGDFSQVGNVYLTNSTVARDVSGARLGLYGGSFSGNAIIKGYAYLTNSTVGHDVYGVYSNADLVDQDVPGSPAGTSPGQHISSPYLATGNVYITNSSVAGSIYGASTSASAIGNIYLYGNVKLQDDSNGITQYNSSIWGGYLPYLPDIDYNVFNDNLLSMGSSALTVKAAGNFANYDFYLNDYNKGLVVNNPNGTGGKGLLTITDKMQNNNTVEDDGAGGKNITENKSTIHVAGISGVNVVNQGQSVVLIDASSANSFILGDTAASTVNDISGLFTTQTGDIDTNIKVGLVGEADVRYTVDSVNNKIIATIDALRISRDNVNLNVKPLAEGRLAALENTTRGADLLSTIMGENKLVGTFTPIAAIDGGFNKYNSGSHIDTRDYRLMVGSRYQVFDNLYAGIAFEYGRSNYDTTNEFGSSVIHGNGNTNNYGASLFTKYTNQLSSGDIYVDGALRFGRTSTEFSSGDIVTGSGDVAHYKSRVNYLGANVGLGFIYKLDEHSSFDSSIRYFWTRLGVDSVVLDGDKVNFDKATSSRLQFKEQYSYKSSDALTVSFAGIYEYEFDGKAGANVSGIGINAPNVQGSTGIIELGFKGTPISDNKDFSFNISFKGYGGERNGASASAFIQYDF